MMDILHNKFTYLITGLLFILNIIIVVFKKCTRNVLKAEADKQRIWINAISNNIGDGIIFIDESGKVVFVNEVIRKIIDIGEKDCKGITYNNLIDIIKKKFYDTVECDEAQQGKYMSKQCGNSGNLAIKEEEVTDKAGTIVGKVIILPNVLECDITHQLIHKMARYDTLTGLANRNFINESLEKTLEEAEKSGSNVAVAFIDLDNFKLANDTMGHDFGDMVLKRVANLVQSCLEEGDFAGRLGGDEFILVMPYSKNSLNPISKVKRFMDMLDKVMYIKESELYITASSGVSIYPMHGKDVQSLIKNADTAMYEAKALGKNLCQVYNDEMNLKVKEKHEIIHDLRNAIKNSEFILYYQPQIDITSDIISGIEALIRWKHPVKGIVPPLKFIPAAEETGLILEIGEWVLMEACKQNKEWQDLGYPPMRVAVNLSIRQFEHFNLVNMVKRVLEETGLEPKWLELEITESIAVKCFECAVRKIQQLKELGIYISLDDFGTGYSSFNYLKQLPIDALKIDKIFLDNITSDPNEEYITKTMIGLAKRLKLTVVAEGVENSKQLNFLKKQECSRAQGYLFSKPVKAEELEKVISEYKHRNISWYCESKMFCE